MDLLRQFNKYANDQRSLVQKAMLTAATGVGEALVPQHLEKVITSTIVRLAPEIAVIIPRYDAQKYHEFNRLTALPGQGGAMGEGAVTPTLNSTYARAGRNLKVIRRKGAVTNFLQDSSKNYIDAAAVEMENHLQAHVYDLVAYNTWGNDGASPYSPPGLDQLIQTNRVQGGSFATPLVPTDLSILDDMIDKNTIKQGLNHKKVFTMSPQMLSKYSRLLTNVRLNQGLAAGGMSEVEIPGGWRLQAYRDVPIIQTTQMRPTVVSAVGTCTATVVNAGGTIPAGAYTFRLASVTWGGEQLPCAQFTDTATGTAVCTVALGAADPAALFYKIYCAKNAAGLEKLVAVIPATLFNADGTIGAALTSVRFTSDPSVYNPTIDQMNGATPPFTINASVSAATSLDVPIGGTAGVPAESIILWDLDEFQGMGKYAFTNAQGSRFNGLVTMEPLAKTDDNLPFLIKTYGTLIDAWEATSVMYRNLKVS